MSLLITIFSYVSLLQLVRTQTVNPDAYSDVTSSTDKPYLPTPKDTTLSTKTFTLPPYGGDPDHITLSGFASGASMATRMHIIYSTKFKGVGLIAGGPFGPAKSGDISD